MDGVETRENGGNLAATLSAGAADSVDIVIGFPWLWNRVKEDGAAVSDESGAGDASLEVKWRFLEKGGFSLAVKPGVSLPTGNEGKGLGNGRPPYGVTLIASQDFERSFLYFNVGYVHNEYKLDGDRATSRGDIWSGSVAAGVKIMESHTWPAFLLGGFIYSIADELDVDLGVKTGLNRPETDLAAPAGVTWRF
ncbi:MAG: hypothetical protein H6Q84_2477 [Deltaproteobacteria bacterium]|nr:hypothetical protein [Deltaproteobacteria bacterium]